jgi:hypothetical protein
VQFWGDVNLIQNLKIRCIQISKEVGSDVGAQIERIPHKMQDSETTKKACDLQAFNFNWIIWF